MSFSDKESISEEESYFENSYERWVHLASPSVGAAVIFFCADRVKLVSMAPLIRAENLTKRFGQIEAVRGVTLEVSAGDVVGFLGPNGARKTTTMRMITSTTISTAPSSRSARLPIPPIWWRVSKRSAAIIASCG